MVFDVVSVAMVLECECVVILVGIEVLRIFVASDPNAEAQVR